MLFMDLDKAIQNRHSVRKFSDKKPNWRKIIECIDATRYAPMAGGCYTLRFILVDDKEKIQKIAKACQQRHVGEVEFIVVAFSNPSLTCNEYGKENGEVWARQQAGAAIENFLLKIEESGLATCWVGYFVEEQVKRILKIPANCNVEALFPVGYEYKKSRVKKAKIDLDRILYFNYYDNKKMKNLRKVD